MAGLHRGAPAAYPRRRARASHQQSVEWSRENENLNKLSALLDRDARQGFYSTKSDLQQSAAILLEQEKKSAGTRQADTGVVKRRLEAHKVAMSNIKEGIERLAEGADIAEDLDKVMGGLEDELYGFKCKMRKDYDDLAVRERHLSTEVEDLRGKLRDWESNTGSDTIPRSAAGGAKKRVPVANGVFVDRKKENETKNHPNDQDAIIEGVSGGGGDDDGSQSGGKGYGGIVERINTLIRREGGAAGGWPQHEHDCFLRVWTQASRGPSCGAPRPPPSSPADRAAISSLVRRASTLLPARTADEVRDHLAWHERYKGYLREKKRLTKEWRERRRQEQKTEAETAEHSNGAFSPEGTRDEERRAAAAATVAAAGEREKKKKEVEEWRASKEIEEEKRAQQAEERRRSHGAKADEAKRRQRRVHEEIAAYRFEREREESRRREVERMLAREERMHSQSDLEERVKRDVEIARRRCQEAHSREEQRQTAEDKKKAAASGRWDSVTADRERLLKPTKASKERVLGPEDLDDLEDARANLPAHCAKVAISGRDLRFVGRAVPSWRRGVL